MIKEARQMLFVITCDEETVIKHLYRHKNCSVVEEV